MTDFAEQIRVASAGAPWYLSSSIAVSAYTLSGYSFKKGIAVNNVALFDDHTKGRYLTQLVENSKDSECTHIH